MTIEIAKPEIQVSEEEDEEDVKTDTSVSSDEEYKQNIKAPEPISIPQVPLVEP